MPIGSCPSSEPTDASPLESSAPVGEPSNSITSSTFSPVSSSSSSSSSVFSSSLVSSSSFVESRKKKARQSAIKEEDTEPEEDAESEPLDDTTFGQCALPGRA